VSETIKEIKTGGGEKKFSFISHLLSRPDLSSSDVDIITLSLFGDGLSTVRFEIFLTVLKNKGKNSENKVGV